MKTSFTPMDEEFMRRALCLARRGHGKTSPNPMVGALLVRQGDIIGQGWHHCAGKPHAEIEALRDAERRAHRIRGATLYVTLEPCSTQGRTPPCTTALITAGLREVVIGAIDPNPAHAGRGLQLLKNAGIQVRAGLRGDEATRLNEAFNHWIVQRTPFVTVKAAMTLDGKIATASGESKWITSEKARAYAMQLRGGSDTILTGVNTILADDPSLTFRPGPPSNSGRKKHQEQTTATAPALGRLRRIILDATARTPLTARVVCDQYARLTTIVVGKNAPARRVKALAKKVRVLKAPARNGFIDLPWLLRCLGEENVTSLLVEGGGTVNASFLEHRLAQRVAFFYAPKIIGGRDAIKAVAGKGAATLSQAIGLQDVVWRRLGVDLLLTARVKI